MDKVATVDPDDLEKEALAAAAEAGSLAALSEVRVRYVGRRSALKLALRDVRDRETGMKLNAVRETVESALDRATPNDLVLVFGSFHTVGEAMTWLRGAGRLPQS